MQIRKVDLGKIKWHSTQGYITGKFGIRSSAFRHISRALSSKSAQPLTRSSFPLLVSEIEVMLIPGQAKNQRSLITSVLPFVK